MTIAPDLVRRAEPTTTIEPLPYFNRELSWLEFNLRVLEEAMDERHPLLERVKFLSIFSTNMDEFFMIRVAGIKQQVAAGVVGRSLDGMTPAEQLTAIRRVVMMHKELQRHCWLEDVQPKLHDQGIHLLDYQELTERQRMFCKEYFEPEPQPGGGDQ
jgi:polyphosphate kinase